MSDTPTRISYHPSDGLSYDPTDDVYWDPSALATEVQRAFEICHGCRMCFKFCDAFPTLFSFIDDRHDGDVSKLTPAETDEVMSHCFQCKLCEVQCPYTPRDDHEYQLDVPKLVHRYVAQRARETKPSFGARVLADPDRTGAMARASFGLANAMNRVKLHRWFMEKLLGIHRDKLLPPFAGTTFERWAEQAGHIAKGTGSETVLFQTCYVQNNEPEIGRDTIDVMQHNGVGMTCVKGLQCCGMPAWEIGDLEQVRKQARANLDLLGPHVDAGSLVVAVNPTCSMMMRREWPGLVAEEDRERAQKLADAIRDPSELLWSIRKEERFKTDFQSSPGPDIAYHAPCHLRAQAVGFKGRDLLRKIPGVRVHNTMECCGHDGTWAMTVDGFEASQKVGKKAFDGMQDAEAEVWATDCPLAAIQFEQHAGVKAMHPMSILARAYREHGFPHPIATDADEDDASITTVTSFDMETPEEPGPSGDDE